MATEGYHNWVKKDGSTQYPPESGRYHLYASYACPFASRCLFVRAIKGLDNAVSVSIVSPTFEKTSPNPDDTHRGWVFKSPQEVECCVEDSVFGCKTVRELYERCNDSFGKFTVPVLFDKKTSTIVNNESGEIMRMLATEFDDFATEPDWDLYPEPLRSQIDTTNEWVYRLINSSVYRAGFAQTQEAYDAGVKDVFDGLDRAEEVLSKQRYIAHPNVFTEADIRLFVTLVRFDDVYHTHYKCNKKLLSQYPNLSNYTRDLYQIPGISETVKVKHFKDFYFRSQLTVNPFGIVPVGPNVDFSQPHNRDALGARCPRLPKL